jgi:DNA ligase-1
MKEIRKKDHVVENPIYKIFDFLTIEEFETGIGTIPLSERLDALDNAIPPFFSSDILHIMPQGIVSNMEQVELGLKVANEKGWEGLMIRKDVPYEGKRTNNLLKIKSFYDDEYEVLDIVICNMRFAIGGTEVEEEVLNSVIIEHKGHRVNVGSGWTIEQRRRFKENPSEIIGKTITVQYFEETHNQDGGISLRFPTVKAIYNNDRDI